MTDEQYLVADKFLKIIADNGGQVNTDQYAPKLSKDGLIHKDFFFITEQLLASDIIRYVDGSEKYRIMFTPIRGVKAQELGLRDFLTAEQTKQDKPNIKANNVHIGDNFGNYNQSNSFSSIPTTINTTPSTDNKSENKPIILRAWLLISENSLISGIILLIIGCLLTRYVFRP
jgi:hypothetical protein